MEIDVLNTGKFRMKPRAYFDQRHQTPADRDLTCRGSGNARKNFQDRGFAGAIVPDNSKRFTFVDLKADIAQSPHLPWPLSPWKAPPVPTFRRVAVGSDVVLLRYPVKLEVDHFRLVLRSVLRSLLKSHPLRSNPPSSLPKT